MNCKPGDLAVVCRCADANLNDRIVEVMSAFGNWPHFGFLWTVRSRTPWETWTDGDEHLGVSMKTEFQMPDQFLLPISGVPIQDEILDEVDA